MRTFSGKILLRVPAKIHKELAEEAFESGHSMNQLCVEAVLARRALKKYSPWESIVKLWNKNKKINPSKLEEDIHQTLSQVRNER